MKGDVLLALIGAGASLLVAIVSALLASRNGRRIVALTARLAAEKVELASRLEEQRLHVGDQLERQRLFMTSELEEQRAVRDARRDYEYDAKKRLYERCEPMLFQALELAENARHRLVSLARSAHRGDIRPDGSGWFSRTGYYFRSTSFYLLAPMTTYRILQRRLTTVDLSLEARLLTQYELLKLLFLSFSEDHTLAALEPSERYDPDRADPDQPDARRLLLTEPRVFRRQGLYLGTLEAMTEAFVKGSDDVTRCMSFGEFLRDFGDGDSNVAAIRDDLIALFKGFHPAASPVLWRVLALQVLLYDALLGTRGPISGRLDVEQLFPRPTEERMREFDWRRTPDDATEEEVRTPFLVAHQYLRRRFVELEAGFGARSGGSASNAPS